MPVIIGLDYRPTTVEQIQDWIGQHWRQSRSTQARSQTSDYDCIIASGAPQNEARYPHVVARAHKGTRADIAQFRGHADGQIVDFHQGDSSSWGPIACQN